MVKTNDNFFLSKLTRNHWLREKPHFGDYCEQEELVGIRGQMAENEYDYEANK